MIISNEGTDTHRMAWQRPTVVRMGAADAEGNTMMSMLTDGTAPRRMMGS